MREGSLPVSRQVVLIKAHINMVPTKELEGFRLPDEGLEPAAKKNPLGIKSRAVPLSVLWPAARPIKPDRPMNFWIVPK